MPSNEENPQGMVPQPDLPLVGTQESADDNNELTTRGQTAAVEAGGLALGGPSAPFGVTAADLGSEQPRLVDSAITKRLEGLTATELSSDVQSFVGDIDKGVASKNTDLFLARIASEDGRVISPRTGNPYKTNNGEGPETVESRRLTPEQRELVKETAAEREEAKRLTNTSQEKLKTIASTASFLDDIVSGVASKDTNLFLARIASEDGRVISPRTGNAYRENGGKGPETVEIRRLTPEQRAELKLLLDKRQSVEALKDETDLQLKTIASTASFLDDIVSGVASKNTDLFLARIASEDGRVISPRTGNPYKTNNGEGPETVESRRLTPEQRELISATLAEIDESEAQLSDFARSRVGGGLSLLQLNQALKDVQLAREQSQVPADLERSDADIKQIESLIEVSNRIELFKSVAIDIADRELDKADTDLEISDLRQTDLSNNARKILARGIIVARLNSVVNISLSKVFDTGDLLTRLEAVRGRPGGEGSQQVAAYILQRQLLNDVTSVFSDISPNNIQFIQRLERLRNLPSFTGIETYDYFTEQTRLIEEYSAILVEARTAEIRQAFGDKAMGAEDIISSIMELPVSSKADVQLMEELLESFALYLIARRKDRPDDFSRVFSELKTATSNLLSPEGPPSLELGRNLRAAKYLAARFKDVIAPLYQSARGSDVTRRVNNYLVRRQGFGIGRESFVVNVDRLEEQRALTDKEREYLDSVQALSIFNPHLAALAAEAPATTQVVLEAYFDELSRRTAESIVDGEYFPALFVGLGPNGIAAIGEIVRINPGLASQMLVVDQGEVPGGPFAVPRGPAWELNSANERGSESPVLPDSPGVIAERTGVPEAKTVRAYDSPLSLYPGERVAGADVRSGSINATVPYLTTPDSSSDGRYATNQELATVLQLQSAMLLDKAVLRTEVVSVRPNPDPGRGNKLVDLIITSPLGAVKTVTIQTDDVFISSGLGEPTYGFEIEGSKAEKVLESVSQQSTTEFPKLTDTLGAFTALASREGRIKVLGDTVVIWGVGNSADTLIEYIGGLFREADNPTVRNVTKIYVIGDNDPTSRPRYLKNNDLRGRNGRGNVVEEVGGRVTDVTTDENGRVIFLDTSGNPIKNSAGEIIRASSGIAATGFKPNLDKVLSAYLPEGGSFRKGDGIKELTLPSAPEIAVADVLVADPSISILGTGSRDGFKSRAKKQQLPPEARQALERNGVENAVAIGFRGPDDRAAIRIKVGESPKLRSVELPEKEKPKQIELRPSEGTAAQLSVRAAIPDIASLPATRRDVRSDSVVLSPLFLERFNDFQLSGRETVNLAFVLEREGDQCNISLESEGEEVSAELFGKVANAALGRYFLAYWLGAQSTRRRRDGLRIEVVFRNGRLDLKESYVEPI